MDAEYQIAIVVGHFLLRCLHSGFTVCDIRFGMQVPAARVNLYSLCMSSCACEHCAWTHAYTYMNNMCVRMCVRAWVCACFAYCHEPAPSRSLCLGSLTSSYLANPHPPCARALSHALALPHTRTCVAAARRNRRVRASSLPNSFPSSYDISSCVIHSPCVRAPKEVVNLRSHPLASTCTTRAG